jgi:hypothetical protein
MIHLKIIKYRARKLNIALLRNIYYGRKVRRYKVRGLLEKD